MTLSKILLPALLLSVACAPSASDGDLPFEGDASGVGKADSLNLVITPIAASIDFDRLQKGGKAIITSADSWLEYFGSEAPTDIDFDNEWVAFYGAGGRNTGGFGAEITGLASLPSGGLILATTESSPGFDCIVTQALTTPHSIVKFDIPNPTPRWAVSDHNEVVNRCGPSQDERAAELAESLTAWEQERDEAGNSYTYVRETHSFFANGSFKTTFVVENGVVVERVATQTTGSEVEKVTFREVGDEVGSNAGVHPVALIDDLYAQCKNDVLTLNDEEHFINLTFDAGLLQVCTSFHRQCQDDCSRGPVITSIEL